MHRLAELKEKADQVKDKRAALGPDIDLAMFEKAPVAHPYLADEDMRALPAEEHHLVADFMGFYFNSSDAWDLSYQAEIDSDRCNGLDGSDQPPPPLRGR